MAKISTGYTFGLTIPMTQMCKLIALGNTYEEAITKMWGINRKDHPTEFKRKQKIVKKWTQAPGWVECYRAMVKEQIFPAYGRAVSKITEQIDNDNPWVAQGAAREVLNRFGPTVMGEDDNQIVVRVEGMPTLGAPSVEENE